MDISLGSKEEKELLWLVRHLKDATTVKWEGNCIENHLKDNLEKKVIPPESMLNPYFYAFNCNIYLFGLVTVIFTCLDM